MLNDEERAKHEFVNLLNHIRKSGRKVVIPCSLMDILKARGFSNIERYFEVAKMVPLNERRN